MKLKPKLLRYMTTEEFRVLTAVEIGSKNHDVVPLELISSIAGLRHGGVHKFVNNLLRNKLVAHDRKHYDGYRLTYSGYDYLALRTFVKRGVLTGIGRQVGVGKESDIHVAETAEGKTVIIKLHRLGRVSFRAIKEKRDYHQGRASASWLYLSRLAAVKEFAFMKALHEHNFPVPTPIDQNRHCCIMTLAPGYPLVQVRRLEEPRDVYRQCMALIMRLARHGLIHGDFNEFNLLLSDKRKLTLIDFPQMVSVGHRNSESFFDRDVEGVRRYFERQFHYVDEQPVPRLHDVVMKLNLDASVRASGFDEDKRHNLVDVLEEQRRLRGEADEPEEQQEEATATAEGGGGGGGGGGDGAAEGSDGSDDGARSDDWNGEAVREGAEQFEAIALPVGGDGDSDGDGDGDDDGDGDGEASELPTGRDTTAAGVTGGGRKIKDTALSFNQRRMLEPSSEEEDGDDDDEEGAEEEAAGAGNSGGADAAAVLQAGATALRGVVRHRRKQESRNVAGVPDLPAAAGSGVKGHGDGVGSDSDISSGTGAGDDNDFAVSLSDVRGLAEEQARAVLVDTPFGIASVTEQSGTLTVLRLESGREAGAGAAVVTLFSGDLGAFEQLTEKDKRIFFNCRAQGREYVHRGAAHGGRRAASAEGGRKDKRKKKVRKKRLTAEEQAAEKRLELERKIKLRVRRQRMKKAEQTRKVNRNQNKHRERRKTARAVRESM